MTERCKFVIIKKNEPLGKRRGSRLVDACPILGYGDQSRTDWDWNNWHRTNRLEPVPVHDEPGTSGTQSLDRSLR